VEFDSRSWRRRETALKKDSWIVGREVEADDVADDLFLVVVVVVVVGAADDDGEDDEDIGVSEADGIGSELEDEDADESSLVVVVDVSVIAGVAGGSLCDVVEVVTCEVLLSITGGAVGIDADSEVDVTFSTSVVVISNRTGTSAFQQTASFPFVLWFMK